MNVLAILPDYIPSFIIGIVTPLNYLKEHHSIQFMSRLEHEVRPEEVLGADVIVTGRNNEPIFKPIYELALQHRIPIVSELDDNLLHVPPADRDHKYYNDPKRVAHLCWMLRHSSLVRVYSSVLADIVRPLNRNTALVRASVDGSLVPDTLPPLSYEPFKIVYATSRIYADSLYHQLHEDLLQLLRTYPNQIELHCLGYHPRHLKRFSQVRFVPFEPNYKTFFTRFTHAGYAIGLAPMLQGAFYASKTNNKFREYAAAGAAGIYADTTLYREGGVIERETGLLVSGEPGSWFEAIRTYIDDPTLIEVVRVNARRLIRDQYSVEAAATLWLEHLQQQISPQPINLATLEPWWFTRLPKQEASLVKRIRSVYRKLVPISWRMVFRRVRFSIRQYFYKIRTHFKNR